jgi:heme iron utilization protein
MAEGSDGAAAPVQEPPFWVARKLLRAARGATLATILDGQPFASLVTLACTPGLDLLMLLSDLSEHTRHLRADARCSLLAVGVPDGANPQTAPRVTVTGLAEVSEDAADRQRFLALHPYAALYADFGDFRIWRVRPRAALFVGGFARANRLRQTELLPEAGAARTLAEAESDIVAHCNDDHPDAVGAIARAAGGEAGAWRMAAADGDGCDLVLGERVLRVPWAAPVVDAQGVRAELLRLARAARG